MNGQFSVCSLYNVTRNMPQTTYILVALKIKKRWQKFKKTLKHAFFMKK